MSTTPWPLFYTLPSCPTITTQDRFGLLDADTPSVPFWSVLSALLTPPVTSLPAFLEILEIIAVELRGTAPPDYNTLKSCLQAREAELLNTIWPKVKELALDMPRLFPMHRLPVLKDGGAKVELSREQVGCLVAHQLLSTLAAPLWQDGFQNFEIWYQGEQPHVSAPEIYITAVLDYFAQIATAVKRPEWTVTYELSSQSGPFDHGMLQDRMKELGDIELRPMSEKTSESESLGTSGNAVVISANRFIGFGRSATQEEVFVGTTPEVCPGVLVTPPLTDSQVLVVRGCEAVVKTVGQGRQIRMCGTHTKPHDEIGEEHRRNKWRDRTMLFMDALELDSYDGAAYPDVEHANVEREMAKALRAFGSANYPRIYTGLWGCRTFGGDPEVKMTILWLAATVKESAFVITYEEEREDFAQKMARFVELVRARGYKVGDVWDLLWEAEGSGIAKWGFLDWVFGRR